MTIFYKAVHLDGTSWWDHDFRWVPNDWKPEHGPVLVRHPRHERFVRIGDASSYLSVATVATDCTGMHWPSRLLAVVPGDDEVHTTNPHGPLANKRASLSWHVVDELPAWQLLGPQGADVVKILDRFKRLTLTEAYVLHLRDISLQDRHWLQAKLANANRRAAGRAITETMSYDTCWLLAAECAALATAAADLIGPDVAEERFMRFWREVVSPGETR